MIDPRDILFLSCFRKYGTLSRRVAPISRGGEDIQETFSRSGPAAYFVDRGGVLRQATAHTARVTYLDPLSSGTRDPYWLLEDTRTNICLQSQTLNTTWSPVRASIGNNADVAPDGTTTAERLIEDNTAGNSHYLSQGTITITANANVALSVYAKAATRSWMSIQFSDLIADGVTQYFNTATGAVGTPVLVGAGTIIRTKVEALASGWYRLILICNIGNGKTNITCRLNLASADNTVSYNGDGASYLSLWGVQIENAVSSNSSYIPTTTVSVARVAEAASFPFYAAPQAMTLYARFIELGTRYDTAVVRRLLNIGTTYTGAAPDTLVAITVPGGNGFYNLLHQEAATGVSSVMAASPTYGQLVELRGVLSSTGTVQLNQSINLAAEVSAAASGALALPTSWGTQQVTPNGDPSATFRGWAAFDTIAVVRGAPSLTDLRALRT